MRIIAGEARGRPIVAPRGEETRPALDRTRESIFSILGDTIEGASVLDLFAGSGAFGLEALGRGARSVVFVENNPAALRSLERNIKELGFEGRSRVRRSDALTTPARDPAHEPAQQQGPTQQNGDAYDFVFLDPPFALLDHPGAAERLRARVEELLAGDLASDGALVLRLPAERELPLLRRPQDQRLFGASRVLFYRGAAQ